MEKLYRKNFVYLNQYDVINHHYKILAEGHSNLLRGLGREEATSVDAC